jgi:glycosyltransferase involved in cell wall biosynthesis
LLNQSYRELEIILVNDGSKDGTLARMQHFSRVDDRIKIVDLVYNKGLGQARFSGILAAKGDYITFADADDWIPSNGIETLFLTARRTNADIVEGSIVRTLGKTGLIKRIHRKREFEISSPALFDNYYISFFGINLLSVTLWGKLYRRSLFDSEGVRASEFTMGEDLLLNMRLFPNVSKYVSIPDIVYYYRIGGMTSHYNTHFYPDLKAQYFIKLDAINKYDYFKALRPTKIEMCNIVCSQVKQMLLYQKSMDEIRSFLQDEIDSGFIDEISENISYPNATLLAGRDREAIIKALRKGMWKSRIRRFIYSFF